MTREGIPGRAAAGKQAAARRSNRLRGRVKISYHELGRRGTEVAGSAHPAPKGLLKEALRHARDVTSRAEGRGNGGAQVVATAPRHSGILQHVHSVFTTPSHTVRARSHAGATRRVLSTCGLCRVCVTSDPRQRPSRRGPKAKAKKTARTLTSVV